MGAFKMNLLSFTNDRLTALKRFSSRKSRLEYIIDKDISNGNEFYELPAISYKKDDEKPEHFHYVSHYIECGQEPVPLNRSLALIKGCECDCNCNKGQCYCSSYTKSGRYYSDSGTLCPEYSVENPEAIYECNPGCKCNVKKCKNRVIQDGSRVKLVLFKTKSRGWGIRALQSLKRGTFIGIYTGELISGTESQKRKCDTYLFNLAGNTVPSSSQQQQQNSNELQNVNNQTTEVETTISNLANDSKNNISTNQLETSEDQQQADDNEPITQDSSNDGSSEQQDTNESNQKSRNDSGKTQPVETYVCDARFYGNFTRFVNHSCEPNLVGIRSYTSHQDYRFPYIAFFTNTDISKYTELTLNYGDNYWLVKCKRDKQYCRCRTSSCKFDKKKFPQTLEEYNQQHKHKAPSN